jgi:ribosome-binding protein aMBF1 (putative translation factor)
MAKKAKVSKKPAAAKSSDIGRKVPSEGILKSLLRTKRRTAETANEANSDYGTAVRSAVEKHALDKKAWGFAVQLDKMEPEKLARTLDHIEHYIDVLGLQARADQVQDLPLGGEKEEDEGADTGNVTSIGTAARKVVEAAGEKSA